MPPSPDSLDSQLDELVAQAAAQTAALSPEDDADPGNSGAESIDQLDDLLSERADEALEGAFETVDEVLGTEREPEQAAAAAPPPGDDDDTDAANFQTLDEALDEMTGVETAAASHDTAGADDAAPPPQEDTTASAADVAAALDAEEAAAADGAPAEQTPPVSPQPAAVAAAASTAPAQAAVKPAAEPKRGPSLVTRALAMTWAPRWMRDLTGFLGIQTLLLAACLFTYATAGRDIALITLAAALPVLTILFYLTFIRRRPAA